MAVRAPESTHPDSNDPFSLQLNMFQAASARSMGNQQMLCSPGLRRYVFVADLFHRRMSDGKKAVWKLADPMREGSIIREAWTPQQAEPLRLSPKLDPEYYLSFIDLYGLDDKFSVEANPYGQAAALLMPLLEIECNHSTIAKFLSFIGHTEPEYRQLLSEKDPLALLLLAYWYAKLCQYKQWWVQPRAVLECQAICVFLERYYSDEDRIQTLLRFPRLMSGFGSTRCRG